VRGLHEQLAVARVVSLERVRDSLAGDKFLAANADIHGTIGFRAGIDVYEVGELFELLLARVNQIIGRAGTGRLRGDDLLVQTRDIGKQLIGRGNIRGEGRIERIV